MVPSFQAVWVLLTFSLVCSFIHSFVYPFHRYLLTTPPADCSRIEGGHIHVHAYIWAPRSKQGRQHTLWALSLRVQWPGDSESEARGVCRHLCARACRHVLSEEASMTQSHHVCVYLRVPAWMCLRVQVGQRLWPPGDGGNGCD